MKTFLALALALIFLSAAEAEELVVSPSDAVAGHPGVTYADLLRQVLKDAAATDGNWFAAPPRNIRHIDGPDFADDPPPALDFSSLSVMRVQSAGKNTIWMLLDLGTYGSRYALLAAFDDSAQPKLIDAARVDADTFTSFVEPLRISAKDEAVILTSSHFNAGENYDQPALVFLNGSRITEVERLLVYNMSNCTDFEATSYHFTTSATPRGLWSIKLEAKHGLATFDSEDGCREPTDVDFGFKTYSATFVWNRRSGAYEKTNDTLGDLYPEEEGDEAATTDASSDDAE